MEVFEIHITGDQSILDKTSLKTIAVELLNPDLSVLRTEYMTSQVKKFRNYDCCKEFVNDTVNELKNKSVDIIRVKIESPYYEHYKDRSLYIESHFETKENRFPLSRNVKKTVFLGTDREYDKKRYDKFREKYIGKEVEICLFDSNVKEDSDWMSLYSGG